MNTTNKTTKKTTAKAVKKVETMNYPQVKALAACLFKAQRTKREVSSLIEKMPNSGTMDKDKKAEWLKAHGEEPASYRQCMMVAMCYFKSKAPKEQVQQIIEQFDKASGYKPKAKKTAKAKTSKKTIAKA